MPSSPQITTVIPTFRRPHLLGRAIRSALYQTYASLQVCVYDNGSGDQTAEVVAEFAKSDPRIRYHSHGENIGGYANFQYGLDHVTTPFFSILADDDVLLPDFYEVAMAGFEQYPQAVMSMCGMIHVNAEGKVWLVHGTDWRPGLYPPPEGMLAMLKVRFPIPWTSFVFRREALDVAGPLDESIGPAADFDFEFRLLALRPWWSPIGPGQSWSAIRHPDRPSHCARSPGRTGRVRCGSRKRFRQMCGFPKLRAITSELFARRESPEGCFGHTG